MECTIDENIKIILPPQKLLVARQTKDKHPCLKHKHKIHDYVNNYMCIFSSFHKIIKSWNTMMENWPNISSSDFIILNQQQNKKKSSYHFIESVIRILDYKLHWMMSNEMTGLNHCNILQNSQLLCQTIRGQFHHSYNVT